ncbi:hypothetical protein JD79_04404 [Geodermatophilus normandii]|uniref:Uncharacterized protein n=1 Tax=Geodermatophilus normandii TaxID=1137989 RepID=A0A317QRE7_9ACTN|nr:hypothetical protein JD79_04404 [Geodermatophilus normandii]
MTATRFRLNLPALPAGYVDAERRSAMRGRFRYSGPADRAESGTGPG